jgi:hypothetical protein
LGFSKLWQEGCESEGGEGVNSHFREV